MWRSLCSRLRSRGCSVALQQNLDGDRLLILRVIALAAVHRAHAAVPENGHDTIRTDARADQPVLVVLQQRFCGFADGVQQEVFAPGIRFEQGLDG